MKTIYKEALRQHILYRIDRITDPRAFALGLTSNGEALARLSELQLIAQKCGMFDEEQAINEAKKPIHKRIDEEFIRAGFGPVYGE